MFIRQLIALDKKKMYLSSRASYSVPLVISASATVRPLTVIHPVANRPNCSLILAP